MNLTLNTFFGRVMVINLETRVDRRAEMGEQLRDIGLGFDSPNVQLFQATKPQHAAGFESVGAHGCFMSHLTVLRQARDQGVGSVVILEDDLNFCERFSEKFDTIARFLKSEPWGILYGSYFVSEPLEHSALPCVQATSKLLIGTTAFLAISGQHIPALVAYLEAMLTRLPGDPQGGPMHIDGAYCWFRQSHPEVVTWLCNPAVGFQRASKTDVHSLRWFDRVAWLAWLIAKVRRLRNRMKA
jgi:hypothetical protein